MRGLIILILTGAALTLDALVLDSPGNLNMAWIVPAVTAVSGLVGLLQRRSAGNLEANNPFPFEPISPALLQNAAVAEQMAGVGLPGQQYSLAQQGIQRNLSGVLRQTQAVGGYGVNLPSILRQANYSQQQLDASNAAAQMNNQRLAMQARTQLAGEQARTFGWNERTRYSEAAARIAALRSAGNQNIAGALGFLGQMYAGGVWGNPGNNNQGAPINTSLTGAQSQNNYNSMFGAPLGYSLGSGYGMSPSFGVNA